MKMFRNTFLFGVICIALIVLTWGVVFFKRDKPPVLASPKLESLTTQIPRNQDPLVASLLKREIAPWLTAFENLRTRRDSLQSLGFVLDSQPQSLETTQIQVFVNSLVLTLTEKTLHPDHVLAGKVFAKFDPKIELVQQSLQTLIKAFKKVEDEKKPAVVEAVVRSKPFPKGLQDYLFSLVLNKNRTDLGADGLYLIAKIEDSKAQSAIFKRLTQNFFKIPEALRPGVYKELQSRSVWNDPKTVNPAQATKIKDYAKKMAQSDTRWKGL